ncbi:hypothetical protein FBU30_002439, partial [Linnemannia zychae]
MKIYIPLVATLMFFQLANAGSTVCNRPCQSGVTKDACYDACQDCAGMGAGACTNNKCIAMWAGVMTNCQN